MPRDFVKSDRHYVTISIPISDFVSAYETEYEEGEGVTRLVVSDRRHFVQSVKEILESRQGSLVSEIVNSCPGYSLMGVEHHWKRSPPPQPIHKG